MSAYEKGPISGGPTRGDQNMLPSQPSPHSSMTMSFPTHLKMGGRERRVRLHVDYQFVTISFILWISCISTARV